MGRDKKRKRKEKGSEMKMIKRYYHGNKQSSIAIGSFVGTGLYLNLTTKFNIIVTRWIISGIAYDFVVNQGIESVIRTAIETLPIGSDDPAFTSVDKTRPGGSSANGVIDIPDHTYLPSGTVFNVRTTFHFFAVTANQIRIFNDITIEYLCPEDYMSIEAFAAKL